MINFTTAPTNGLAPSSSKSVLGFGYLCEGETESDKRKTTVKMFCKRFLQYPNRKSNLSWIFISIFTQAVRLGHSVYLLKSIPGPGYLTLE